MNSEIYGIQTSLSWGFKFVRDDPKGKPISEIPSMHPTQIYEAVSYLLLYLFLIYMYWKKEAFKREGLLFGIFMIGLWGVRFFVEFVKEGQTARDYTSSLNTGQMLSIPFFFVGIWLVIRAFSRKPENA